MKKVSLKLPDDLHRKLTLCAERRGMTKSALIRESLASYFALEPSPERISVLELAGDLVGCLEGPGDLSFNKKYMKGFGKKGAHPLRPSR